MAKKSNSIYDILAQSPSVDKVGVEERTARFQTRSIKNEAKWQGLNMVLNMIDLTTLEGKDTPGKVRQMCYKAHHLHDSLKGLPSVAAVCVYPSMVKLAKDELKGTDVKVASVSTAFPSGQAPHSVKIDDTKFAVDSGADEIDMVISRGKFLAGDYQFVFDEIASIKGNFRNRRTFDFRQREKSQRFGHSCWSRFY
jgi:deoxyribose-phosphate aldolase